MSKSRSKNIKDTHASRKEAVLKTSKTNRRPVYTAIFCAAVLAAAAVLYWTMNTGEETKTASAPPAGNLKMISFPVKSFDDGRARHYEHVDGSVTIRYFVLKSTDGVIRAAFDACDVCWPAGKGYYQDGDDMVCRNCGRRFASVRINEVKGGCNPAPLAREIKDEQLVIQISDIENGRTYFNFEGNI